MRELKAVGRSYSFRKVEIRTICSLPDRNKGGGFVMCTYMNESSRDEDTGAKTARKLE